MGRRIIMRKLFNELQIKMKRNYVSTHSIFIIGSPHTYFVFAFCTLLFYLLQPMFIKQFLARKLPNQNTHYPETKTRLLLCKCINKKDASQLKISALEASKICYRPIDAHFIFVSQIIWGQYIYTILYSKFIQITLRLLDIN